KRAVGGEGEQRHRRRVKEPNGGKDRHRRPHDRAATEHDRSDRNEHLHRGRDADRCAREWRDITQSYMRQHKRNPKAQGRRGSEGNSGPRHWDNPDLRKAFFWGWLTPARPLGAEGGGLRPFVFGVGLGFVLGPLTSRSLRSRVVN